jgi:hypothetical protein
MAVLTLTINTPATPFGARSAEVAWLEYCLLTATVELRRAAGNQTSGTIVGTTPAGPAASLGSWTYTPTASNP